MPKDPRAADPHAASEILGGQASHNHAIQTGRGGAMAPAVQHDIAHEMGHRAVMDMQAMVRDMRNRFWISLVFSIPIFLY